MTYQNYPQDAVSGKQVPSSYPQSFTQPQELVGGGLLLLHLQGNEMTSSLVPPTVILDGYPLVSRYGDHPIQLAPGRHHIQIYQQWMRRYGNANLAFEVLPNTQVDVWYAGALHQFCENGSIGFEKQKANGKLFFIILFGLAALSILTVILIAVLAM